MSRARACLHKIAFYAILFSVVLRNHKRRGQDLAQPPSIVWRGKQMNVEQTPVPEAVCWANDVLADAGCNRHEATPGDTWCSLSQTSVRSLETTGQKKSAPRGAFFMSGLFSARPSLFPACPSMARYVANRAVVGHDLLEQVDLAHPWRAGQGRHAACDGRSVAGALLFHTRKRAPVARLCRQRHLGGQASKVFIHRENVV